MSADGRQMRSHLGRVRGLGSAGEGVGHWWAQRITALAMAPLSLWFAYAAVSLVGADLAALQTWLNSDQNLVLLVLFIVVGFHHAQMGVQVVIEDYVHHEGWKTAGIIAVKMLAVFLAGVNITAALRLTIGS